MKRQDLISIRNASENNLRSVSLDIPKNKLVVVTGVSGSGKSSLVFDVLFREAERRYLATFTAYARQFLQKTHKPEVESIIGLSPAIAIDQHAITRNPRSTVGTLTEIYDYLRLLYARTGGQADKRTSRQADKRTRSLFSFNSPEGACPVCKGLGVEDALDPGLLIADPTKSIREGAMVITAPNGYIIYSQVTLDVLNQVCQAEGFTIDIPWQEMTEKQKNVILFGSDKLEVPFGKHTLESRMRWSGITAKPREMGYYKGVIPVMETILQRERNKNILRFVRTKTCHACQGKRLKPEALAFTIHRHSISDLNDLSLSDLEQLLSLWQFDDSREMIARPIIDAILLRIRTLRELGLGYLACSRESTTLSTGEAQRIRLAVQLETNLQGILYIFDEPSVGLHPSDSMRIINALKKLRDKGNSVVVVEHEEAFIRHADHLIDIGPGAGSLGGEVILNCPVTELGSLPEETIARSATLQYLFRRQAETSGQADKRTSGRADERTSENEHHGSTALRHLTTISPKHHITIPPHHYLSYFGVTHHNLRNIDVRFQLHSLNVVTGVSGAGKSSLVNDVVGKRIPGTFREISGEQVIRKTIVIDQNPIGKSSRSNPATYTGLFDLIRDRFAALPEARERHYTKSRFSFNTGSGRCPDCEGTGYHQIGMHFMGTVETECETCHGRQFNEETLEIRLKGKTIADILDLTIEDAMGFFSGDPPIFEHLKLLHTLGLGYLHLGQRSSTLSGGEAQRIKLATELYRKSSGHTLYLLDEPTTGLHSADVDNLLKALRSLTGNRHTVILIEHHPALILAADHVIDLGPGSGADGGRVVAEGPPETIINTTKSLTGQALKEYLNPKEFSFQILDGSSEIGDIMYEMSDNESQIQDQKSKIQNLKSTISHPASPIPYPLSSILLTNVSTHNLKNISCSIPHNRITVITGVSGSGKSSLAFDTIVAEGQNRFLTSFSSYARSRIGIKADPEADSISGLTPVFAVDQRNPGSNPRSTIGTYSGIHDIFRLLYSRFATRDPVLSSLFSFNDKTGACPVCEGLGVILRCAVSKLIVHPGRSLINGAMEGTKTGRFYGDPFGQYVATLKAVGERHHLDFSLAWHDLSEDARILAMEGSGEEVYDITWEFRRKERTGRHHFRGVWAGFARLVEEEYRRKHADHRGEEMKHLMEQVTCQACNGKRLNPESLSYTIAGMNLAEISDTPLNDLLRKIPSLEKGIPTESKTAVRWLLDEIRQRLDGLDQFGLGYLTLGRSVESLSGSEFQRLKLAGQTGSQLTGITYVLDEPSAGLPEAEVPRLMEKIRMLRDEGNTMILVEHNPEMIRRADYLIDLGPGAGDEGGEILASGTPEEIMRQPHSVTAPLLTRVPLPVTSCNRIEASGIGHPASRSEVEIPIQRDGISIQGATLHNLQSLNVDIPLGGIIVITGPSGSGKSTLLQDVLLASLESGVPVGCKNISGTERIHGVVPILQKRHFDESRGTPVTYTGLFDGIRNLFAKTQEARERGLTKNHFSFLSPAGRCENCNGTGEIRVSMDFMADVSVPCEICHGTRYKPGIPECHLNGKNIADVLSLSFREAETFFYDQKSLRDPFALLRQIGLGYLKLGQPLSTLSGGEAQRLTLVRELLNPSGNRQLFVFQEPALGLHPNDLPALIRLFDQLADQGNTLLMTEHHPEMILHADWIIQLGPGSGNEGGKIIRSGKPI